MIFDLNKSSPGQGKSRVLLDKNKFKTRIIELSKGEKIPHCEMSNMDVLFIVIVGEVVITVNGEENKLTANQMLSCENATLNMKTPQGAKILGIQIG